MKKKLFVVCLLILSVFIISGCKNIKNDNNNSSKGLDNDKKSDALIIDGYDLSLTEDSSFYDIKFKYPKGVDYNSLGTYTILAYSRKDGPQTLFKIGITKFDNKTVDEGMVSDKLMKIGTKSYNDISWTVYEVEGKDHTYAMESNKDLYTINFIYDPGLEQFEEEFMKNVKIG